MFNAFYFILSTNYMELSIIIVSWNVKDKLRENLKALEKSKGDFLYEVIVVDNNSARITC